MRTRSCIDSGWQFIQGERGFSDLPDGEKVRTVDLPHDMSIEATPNPDNPAGAAGGFFPGGTAWYRKCIDVPADLGSRHMMIEFDGVYMNSEVWCNGRSCGVRPYGYSSFCYDLTPLVKAGEQAVITVRADNSRQRNSRWYTGTGIYRHVWLTIAGEIRVHHWGTYITTQDVSAESATVKCAATVINEGMEDAEICVRASLPGDGSSAVEQACVVGSGRQMQVNFAIDVPKPRLWTPDSPELYTMRIEIVQAGAVIDTHYTRFGIRSIRFDADTGFHLNGQGLKLRGVNEHHDAGCLGAAVPDDEIRRRLRILKGMGCNAIRSAHNPASPALLDICDEMGFMVVEDAFDEWKDGKTPFGYQLYWDEWWERDLADMIRRDRNHPCIVMWSVGNEIKEVREGRPEGLSIMKALRDVCHREDPTRPVTCGCCNSRETLKAGYGDLMDVMGYNGGGGGCFDYEKDHEKYPGMKMFASEVPHTLQTRGVYRTRTWYRDLARNKGNICWHESATGGGAAPAAMLEAEAKSASFFAGIKNARPLDLMYVPHYTEFEVFGNFDEHYQSSYDNALVRISASDSWQRTKRLPFFCGEFRWTGFDYIGECYSWPAKSWNFGIIDLCGFPKDTYYLYKSEWTVEPMVHILPHWTWPGLEGKKIPVIAYSNCDEVELFQDGKSLGTIRKSGVMYLRWDVEYRSGQLKAVGIRRDESGQQRVECIQKTAGEPAAVRLSSEESHIRADGTGIAHIAATIVDKAGTMVPYAGHDIFFKVEGPGMLIGVENGDPIDTSNYKLNHRRAFHGMMLAIVRSTERGGKITISAESEGLSPGSCTVVSA